MKLYISLSLFLTVFNSYSQTKVLVEIIDPITDTAISHKLDTAVQLIQNIINSDDFESQVKNGKYIRRRKKNPTQIFDLIRVGAESHSQPDSCIQLRVSTYETKRHEIGYTDENGIIHTNTDYILENGATCYAAHLIHEYCHVLGFRHAKIRLPFRSKTVPYKIGDLTAELLHADCP